MRSGAILLSLLSIAAVTHAAPRPISNAERTAVAIVARAMQDGPEAVWNELAATATLRALSREEALREIAVRFGPAKGSTWTLETADPSLADRMAVFGVEFQSGTGDTVIIGMAEERGAWKVESIRTAAEPGPLTARPVIAKTSERVRPEANVNLRAPAMIIGGAFLIGIAALMIRRRGVSRLLLAISIGSIIAAVALLGLPFVTRRTVPGTTEGASEIARAPLIRLGSMKSLREAFAAGDETPFASFTTEDPRQRDVAKQWRAALLIRTERLDEARKLLAPLDDGLLMSELLRARIAFQEKKDVEAVSAYERAIASGPDRDSVWLEAAEVLSVLGFDARAGKYLDRTARLGTRHAVVYYTLAARTAMEEKPEDAARLLLSAWEMRPVERARVIGTPVFWRVLRLPGVAKALALHEVEEASFAARAERPIEVPGTTAELSGTHLRLRAGGAEIEVPGGASIAPADAAVLDAGAWNRRREEEALASFADVRARATSATAFADPGYRDRSLDTAAALAKRNRWGEIITLTDALSARDERVPLELMVLRGRALVRLERPNDLRPLIRDLLLNPSFRRKKDPASMRLIGELLASLGDYDSAIALLNRSRQQMALPGMDERITQLEIERRLARAYSVLKTDHFNVKYPPDTRRTSVERLAAILESEYQRLQPMWFPRLQMKPVTVNVLWWQDFRLYAGSDAISGLFTSEMFLPLAGLNVFTPPAVEIATHELVHAMLAAASDNLAPRWFHEALASRVEMRETSENGFLKYRDDRYLSVALLDAVAERSVDPSLISEAYSLGESTLRFIEARYGRRAVLQMTAAFADGADTESAVRAATKLSLAELDRAARAWGNAQPHLFENEVIRYDQTERVRVRR